VGHLSRLRLLALLPVLLLALLTCWTGTFPGAATALGALLTQLGVIGFCLLGSAEWHDPLRLGNVGRWLVLLALVVAVVSWLLSPVARAGHVGLILLPALLLIPAATRRCWRQTCDLRTGVVALSVLTLSVGGIALASWPALDLLRPALPVGHHNLLAGWLILVLPLSLVPVRYGGLSRWAGVVAALCGLAALAASKSLLGGMALGAQLLAATMWWPRARRWFLPAILLLLLVAFPRLIEVGQGVDSSARARSTYLAASWRGLVERPAIGWGPGAAAWTIGEFMRPQVGVNPASEVVGDLHSLPAELAYEMGALGLGLAMSLGGIFARQRLREQACSTDRTVQRAALLGLLGAVVFSLGSAPLAVPALPVTAAVIAGAALGPRSTEHPENARPTMMSSAYLLLTVLALVPIDRAHFFYDSARQAKAPRDALAAVGKAAKLDPRFPLYRARRAWLASDLDSASQESAAQARQAATMAPGLAPLWLAAGDLAQRAHLSWAPDAFAQAHRLDPLSPLAAFHLLASDPERADAVDLGVFAVRAEPRLAAAVFWCHHLDLAQAVSERMGSPIPNGQAVPSTVPTVLTLTMDRVPAASFSLYAFRRSPWPAGLAPVPLDVGICQTFDPGVQ